MAHAFREVCEHAEMKHSYRASISLTALTFAGSASARRKYGDSRIITDSPPLYHAPFANADNRERK